MINSKVLIISNNGLSDFEPNGRAFSSLFDFWDKDNLYSFCIGGVTNINNVHYINVGIKNCFLSLVSLGFIKPLVFTNSKEKVDIDRNNKSHKKTPFKYFLRNMLYSFNIFYRHQVNSFVKKEKIKNIFVFGTDAPFLYKDAYYYSKKNKIPLYCYTGEDYCFKDYNYLEKGRHNNNIFLLVNKKLLYRNARKAFEHSTKCFFTSVQLEQKYRCSFSIKSSMFKPLPSLLNKVNYQMRSIKKVVYGGNLYNGRLLSLLKVASVLREIDETITLHIYGKMDDDQLPVLKDYNNIVYYGVVKYSELVNAIKTADLLIQVEGFDEYYKKDCEYSFSTKMSDYYVLGIPFFVYSPIEIVSTAYALHVNQDFTAINTEELRNKLKRIIDNKIIFRTDYNQIKEDFRPFHEKDFLD